MWNNGKAAARDVKGRLVVLIHGLANGVSLDDKRFWPIFERAQALDVPIYLHPSVPLSVGMDVYYNAD